ncbi:MAG: hypothetical protein WD533_01585 [Dehalococcoidia bacterium]
MPPFGFSDRVRVTAGDYSGRQGTVFLRYFDPNDRVVLYDIHFPDGSSVVLPGDSVEGARDNRRTLLGS